MFENTIKTSGALEVTTTKRDLSVSAESRIVRSDDSINSIFLQQANSSYRTEGQLACDPLYQFPALIAELFSLSILEKLSGVKNWPNITPTICSDLTLDPHSSRNPFTNRYEHLSNWFMSNFKKAIEESGEANCGDWQLSPEEVGLELPDPIVARAKTEIVERKKATGKDKLIIFTPPSQKSRDADSYLKNVSRIVLNLRSKGLDVALLSRKHDGGILTREKSEFEKVYQLFSGSSIVGDDNLHSAALMAFADAVITMDSEEHHLNAAARQRLNAIQEGICPMSSTFLFVDECQKDVLAYPGQNILRPKQFYDFPVCPV